MKLIDNFFRIVERGDGQCRVAMNGDHEIYKAHFPGNPITPGVCLVQMATEIYQEMRGEQLELAEVGKIKYRNVVKPTDAPTYCFTPIENEGESLKVKVVVRDEEKVFTEMSLNYQR